MYIALYQATYAHLLTTTFRSSSHENLRNRWGSSLCETVAQEIVQDQAASIDWLNCVHEHLRSCCTSSMTGLNLDTFPKITTISALTSAIEAKQGLGLLQKYE